MATLTLAALCVHNFLREKASDVYLPSAFADTEDENHNVVPGAWRKDRELPSLYQSAMHGMPQPLPKKIETI